MTIVLNPVWSNGVQKLKVVSQSKSRHGLLQSSTWLLNADSIAPTKPAKGLLPPVHNDEIHALRCLQQLRSKDKPIEKYIYLSQLKDADHAMFYRLCLANMAVCPNTPCERPMTHKGTCRNLRL